MKNLTLEYFFDVTPSVNPPKRKRRRTRQQIFDDLFVKCPGCGLKIAKDGSGVIRQKSPQTLFKGFCPPPLSDPQNQ